MNEQSVTAQRADATGGSPGEALAVFSAIAVAAFLLRFMRKASPWLVVVFCALGGEALSLAAFGH